MRTTPRRRLLASLPLLRAELGIVQSERRATMDSWRTCGAAAMLE
jgi:hypothetical protein